MKMMVHFLPCPHGFVLNGSECVCEPRLQKLQAKCNVSDDSIERTSIPFWVGTDINWQWYLSGTYHIF